MATSNPTNGITFEAGADLSSDQYKFVELTSGQVTVADGAGEDVIGVLRTTASAAGRAVTVDPLNGDVLKVVAGAAVSADAKVQTNASGQAITAASGDHVLGTALEAASGAGEVIRILSNSSHILA